MVRPSGSIASIDDLVVYLESATVIETKTQISIMNRDEKCGRLEIIDRSGPEL